MKKIAVLFLSVFLLHGVFAEGNKFSLWGSGEVFKLNTVTDSILLGSGTLIYGTELVLDKGLNLRNPIYTDTKPMAGFDDINGFDRFFAGNHGYNHTIDTISDVLLISSFFLPASLAGTGYTEYFTIAAMYAETMLLSQGIKESIKLVVNRPRPYMYFEGFPEKDVYTDNDWANSFLSGHSTMSFAAATFTSYTFCKYFPDNPWKYAVVIGSYGLAATVACLRIGAACHFATDVLCGAALGTTIGFLVPFFHTLGAGNNKKETGDAQFAIVPPLGFSISIAL